MRSSSSIALMLCCACGASEPAPAPTPATPVEQQPTEPAPSPPTSPASEQPSEPPASPAPELPPGEPVTCGDKWCRFSAFAPNGELRDIEADGTQVWILDKHGVIARGDGGPGDLPERWRWWSLDADVRDLWVGDGVAVAVGNNGFAARFEADKWTTIDTGTWRDLEGVDGLPGGPVWIAADKTLLRLDKTTVTDIELPSGFSAYGTPEVEVVSDDEIWLMGYLAVWRRKDGEWRKYPFKPPTGPSLGAVDLDSTGPNDVWALEHGNVHHWNGSRWKRHTSLEDVGGPLNARSPNDVIVGDGDASQIFRWDGSKWTTESVGFHTGPMASLADGQLVLDNRVALVIRDGTTTRWAHRGIGFDVKDVWLGEHTTWVVGGNGRVNNRTFAVARFDGRVWQRWMLDNDPAVEVSGLGDDPWVASQSGDVFRLVDGEWQREPTGLTDGIWGIEVTSSGEAWVWNSNGLVRRVDDRWTVVEFDESLRALEVAPDGTVMALSYKPEHSQEPKTLRRWNGSRLEPLGEVPLNCTYQGLLPLARDLAITDCDAVSTRWNGTEWTEPTRIGGRGQTIHDIALVGDKVVAISGTKLVDLDTAELLPTPPIEPDSLYGNPSGRLWVTSIDGDLAFYAP